MGADEDNAGSVAGPGGVGVVRRRFWFSGIDVMGLGRHTACPTGR